MGIRKTRIFGNPGSSNQNIVASSDFVKKRFSAFRESSGQILKIFDAGFIPLGVGDIFISLKFFADFRLSDTDGEQELEQYLDNGAEIDGSRIEWTYSYDYPDEYLTYDGQPPIGNIITAVSSRSDHEIQGSVCENHSAIGFVIYRKP